MTPRKTKKLFISYRSSDAAKVDKIARDLALLKYNDGAPLYDAWQDKHNLPPASPNWWDAIVAAISDCDMFVFNLSLSSLQSEICRAELDYAYKRNRPIIPVVLDGEFFLNPASGKYDMAKETWALVPDWLGESQFLFYIPTEFYSRFQMAVDVFERNWPRDIAAPQPLNPDNKSVFGSNHAVYAAARDYAYRLAFTEAEKHFGALVRRNDAIYADASAHWLERIRLYSELIEMVDRHSPVFAFKQRWAVYESLPTEYLDGESFDPKGFSAYVTAKNSVPNAKSVFSQSSVLVTSNPIRVRSLDILPAPFAWIEIPNKSYSIAKYPVTNAQFSKFIEAGGYNTQRWWTTEGWQKCQEGWQYAGGWEPSGKMWVEPRHWKDSKWNGMEQPVVGVSWFEAVAFCLWLKDVTGEKIMLPTEDQWQYAAQSNDGRDYPWGKTWDVNYCNNNMNDSEIGKTTPVTQYEGKGDSPFGIVDMAGNVWEWCLTDYDNKRNNINSNATYRVLRGGSWGYIGTDYFRCDFRNWHYPHGRNYGVGFRISRSLNSSY